ncbi:AraC family transcriptional regulator [Aquabacterium sp. J223]|uniref:AraC family transcriptional regulator n=1 Tax=Aquabacterium sp. J223 TaxID=2898431 RepID=UPI0021AD7E33|nr:AraC family transcriptional regulator [Aquabacterium sp. J223]UUX95570.1 AraC family transcriptional regulator [Aquabacterium sp. J223]
MDLLSDILQDASLRRRLLGLRAIPPDVALRFPCDRSIGLHVVVQGPVHVHAPTLDAPLALATGDVAFMARGCDHALTVGPELAGLTPQTIAHAPGPIEAGASVVVGGAYQLWNRPLHPFFAELPAWTVLRADARPRLGPLALAAGLMEQEIRAAEPGADTIVQALLDTVFTYALREIAAQRGQVGQGWSHAVRDPQVRRALTLMHERSAHAWTLDELAQQAGLSRTALAERFRDAMGDTPLNHLRVLRMQRAMRLLAETDHKLEAVAAEVGYQDAFSFSKVFKRTLGLSPKAFRQRDAADRSHPWRLGVQG